MPKKTPFRKIYADITGHQKTAALAEYLEIPTYQAVGIVVSCMSELLFRSREGWLAISQWRVIERGIEWDQSKGRLVDILTATGWAEHSDNDHCRIANWEEYMEKNSTPRTKACKARKLAAKQNQALSGTGTVPGTLGNTRERHQEQEQDLLPPLTPPAGGEALEGEKGRRGRKPKRTPKPEPFEAEVAQVVEHWEKVRESSGRPEARPAGTGNLKRLRDVLGEGWSVEEICRAMDYFVSPASWYVEKRKCRFGLLLGWDRNGDRVIGMLLEEAAKVVSLPARNADVPEGYSQQKVDAMFEAFGLVPPVRPLKMALWSKHGEDLPSLLEAAPRDFDELTEWARQEVANG